MASVAEQESETLSQSDSTSGIGLWLLWLRIDIFAGIGLHPGTCTFYEELATYGLETKQFSDENEINC